MTDIATEDIDAIAQRLLARLKDEFTGSVFEIRLGPRDIPLLTVDGQFVDPAWVHGITYDQIDQLSLDEMIECLYDSLRKVVLSHLGDST